MSAFIASNGYGVKRAEHPHRIMLLQADGTAAADVSLRPAQEAALQEFFQHEEDERLGRWRWSETPNFVVYARQGDGHIGDEVRVLDESDGSKVDVSRDHVDRYRAEWDQQVSNTHWHAARAFFNAHSPCLSAKPGEVWVLTWKGVETVFRVAPNRELLPITAEGADWYTDLDAPGLSNGRRIWPEDAS